MFKLSQFFIKQEEAEAPSQPGGEVPESDSSTEGGQTVLTEGQDNTETEEKETGTETDQETTDEEGKEKDSESEEKEGESEGEQEGYSFELPEGMELDQEMTDKFSELAKADGLSNEQANKYVQLYAEKIGQLNQANADAWEAQVNTWADELKSDPDFGGANFDKNSEIARIAVNKFGDDDFKQALNDTGLGNHPAMVKMMYKIGKALSEDSFNVEGNHNGGRESTPQSLYSKSNMNP